MADSITDILALEPNTVNTRGNPLVVVAFIDSHPVTHLSYLHGNVHPSQLATAILLADRAFADTQKQVGLFVHTGTHRQRVGVVVGVWQGTENADGLWACNEYTLEDALYIKGNPGFLR